MTLNKRRLGGRGGAGFEEGMKTQRRGKEEQEQSAPAGGGSRTGEHRNPTKAIRRTHGRKIIAPGAPPSSVMLQKSRDTLRRHGHAPWRQTASRWAPPRRVGRRGVDNKWRGGMRWWCGQVE